MFSCRSKRQDDLVHQILPIYFRATSSRRISCPYVKPFARSPGLLLRARTHRRDRFYRPLTQKVDSTLKKSLQYRLFSEINFHAFSFQDKWLQTKGFYQLLKDSADYTPADTHFLHYPVQSDTLLPKVTQETQCTLDQVEGMRSN